MRVAIVGAGISGLAAAWELVKAKSPPEVTIFDPSPAGGKIRTATFGHRQVEYGPDAFLARVPDAIELCRELGISDELVAPSATRAMVWVGGRLRPLPEGLVLGAPKELGPLLRSGILSPWAMARAGLDLVLPRPRNEPADQTVADLVGRRFGRQVVDRLVDPLVGGIHAGRTDELSAAATVPQLMAAYRSGPSSLLLGLRRSVPAPTPGAAPAPVFLTPRGGLARLVERLTEELERRSVGLVPDAVASLEAGPAGIKMSFERGTGENFDGVIIATPPAVTAALLGPVSAEAAELVRRIPSASVALATLAYPASVIEVPADVSGFLVPRTEGKLMTACSFGTNKWPQWAEPGTAVIRLSTGRMGDHRLSRHDDAVLLGLLRQELADALGRPLPQPLEQQFTRWPDAFPQYLVGHLSRVSRAEAALARDAPRLALAGAGLRGSGLPACIASGRRAAAALGERAQLLAGSG